MSTEQGEGSTSHKPASEHSDRPPERQRTSLASEASSPAKPGDDSATASASASPSDERGSNPQRDQPSESTHPSSQETLPPARQVIAVSASKGPAAFFNLARKFLVTDETCDLSALEGAIVSAVDAAHLLERSKLASIVRIQTSYVTVEPKRRKQAQAHSSSTPPQAPGVPSTYISSAAQSHPGQQSQPRRGSSGRELRRARIVITVRRTESYKKWLDDNPLQAIIAGDGDEEELARGGEGAAAEGTPTTY